MKSNYKRLGNYIKESNIRNGELKASKLLGINIDKFFMPSVANIVGTDMSVYKIVKKGQFACNRMHVGRDYRLPIALSNLDEDFMVSPAYDVFEIIDPKELVPEYLMMWFSRKEFDRNAWFYTDADVRGGLPWKSFCDMQLPIPHPDKQRELVKEYNTIVNRINLNNQLIEKLEETAQAIYKQWFVVGVDIENLPDGWKEGSIDNLCEYSKERISTKELSVHNYISTENMLQKKAGIITANSMPSSGSVTKFVSDNILISNIRPYFKKIWLSTFDGGCSNDVLCFIPKKNVPSLYLYQILEKDNFFEYVMSGSKGTKMPRGDKNWIMNYSAIIPAKAVLEQFNKVVSTIQAIILCNKKEVQKLTSIRVLLLSKLTTIEN